MAPAVKPYEEQLARLLLEHDRSDDVVVTSFHDTALAAFSAAAPLIATSAGLLAVAGFAVSQFSLATTGLVSAPTPST